MNTSEESKVETRPRIPFAFTDEQDQFRAAIRRFLNDRSPATEVRRLMASAAGHDSSVWRRLSEDLALPGIHIAERYGGAGFGMVELCIVMEEMGRTLFCGPYFSTAVLAANAIINAGSDAQKAALLPDIAKGTRLATLAITEPDGNWDPAGIAVVATPEGTGYRVDGVKSYVVDGHIAELLVVAARTPQTVDREFGRGRAPPAGINGSDS
jgi:alkylation response protein AidB-like acyl-CoA dehydrogenase